MKTMLLAGAFDINKNQSPLILSDVTIPVINDSEILIKVTACGVCHTDLDEIEGRVKPAFYPIIIGHQVIGKIVEKGSEVKFLKPGDIVGVGWYNSSCGKCKFCLEGNDNLCESFKATGRDVNGGYSEYMKVIASAAFNIPGNLTEIQAAPLLCAGAIGYRSLRLTGLKNGDSLGLTGFGASAHLVLKLVKFQFPDSKIFVFARSMEEQQFAMEIGAYWTGDSNADPGQKLTAIIDTTPAWKPVVEALKHLEPGGRLVINAIRKENNDKEQLLTLDYPEHLWMEKEIKSVANVSRNDIREFLELAGKIPIISETEEYDLEDANVALVELKKSKIRGAKVLRF